MTDHEPTKPNEHWPELIGHFNGEWVRNRELRLPINDIGFRQGVIAVERLRTYNGKAFVPDRHLNRWERTTTALHIGGLPNRGELRQLIEELLKRNQDFINDQGDVGVTVVATPGDGDGKSSLAMHLNVIDHDTVSDRRIDGQPIMVTSVVQPPNESWSRDIKVRSRIHYYLADQTARAAHKDAIGVLVDSDDCVTETSSCNIAIVSDGEITSPPKDRVLSGVTQSVIEEIAAHENLTWNRRPLSKADLSGADEVLLMGTTGGIWFANRVDQVNLSDKPRPIYSRLLVTFDRYTNGSQPGTATG